MSELRSFGSNYHPSSQSRKISIGVIADSKPKGNPGADNVDANVIARVEKLNSATVTDLPAKKNDKDSSASKQKNSAQAKEHVSSPWRSPRSSYRKLGTLENVLCKQTSSLPGSKVLHKELNSARKAPALDSLKKFPISTSQHSDGKLNSSRNKKATDGTLEGMEELPSTVLPQNIASQREQKDKPDNDKNGSTDVLRSKLWEILGNVASENSQDLNSEAPEMVKTSCKLGQDKDLDGDPLYKPRHNSDSIETDSESPENATRRPVTRSLLRRGVAAKGVQKRTKAGVNLGRKCAEKVNNIFSFEEGLRGKIGTAMNSSATPKKQRGRRKSTVVQCRKVHSLGKNEADGILRETNKSKTPPRSDSTGAVKRSSFSGKKGISYELPPQSKVQKQKPHTSTREEDFHRLPEGETAAKPGMFHGLSKNGDQQERPNNVFMEKSVEPETEFQSPTFGCKEPISSPSPCLTPEASPLHPRNISPALDETKTPIFSFGTKRTSQGTTGQASDKERKLPDFLEKRGDYSFRRESSAEPNDDLLLSDSSSIERDSDDGSQEDSPALGHYNSPEVREAAEWSNEKSTSGFGSAKRNSNLKGTRHVPLSPKSSLPKDSFMRFTEMDEDEGMGRAVALFALALQNFEKKLKSAATKKSSEILASVSEEIHLGMENVKSHILTDTEKTSDLAKTKRKHAETRLQEQQEKMKMIHDKFKDDVSHHLEDFKTTIEGLEENHSGLKGAIKKQRTSHQKLIAHFEGDIETKLVNATRRVNSVNESAREKMVQLKMIIAECLRDD